MDRNREVLLIPTRPPQGGDSPAARAAARARVAAQPEAVKPPVSAAAPPTRAERASRPPRPPRPPRRPVKVAARVGLSRWWAYTSRPSSWRAAWRLSAVTKRRIPLASAPLSALWHLSNYTDRLIMFGLVMVAPTFLTGPLRWIAARPTRRWAFYLMVGAVASTYLPTLH